MTIYRFTIDADVNVQKLDADHERHELEIGDDPVRWTAFELIEALEDGYLRSISARHVAEVE